MKQPKATVEGEQGQVVLASHRHKSDKAVLKSVVADQIATHNSMMMLQETAADSNYNSSSTAETQPLIAK